MFHFFFCEIFHSADLYWLCRLGIFNKRSHLISSEAIKPNMAGMVVFQNYVWQPCPPIQDGSQYTKNRNFFVYYCSVMFIIHVHVGHKWAKFLNAYMYDNKYLNQIQKRGKFFYYCFITSQDELNFNCRYMALSSSTYLLRFSVNYFSANLYRLGILWDKKSHLNLLRNHYLNQMKSTVHIKNYVC